jgi:hypothetical protein
LPTALASRAVRASSLTAASVVGILRQEPGFVPQSFADYARTSIAVGWPMRRKRVVGDFVALNPKRITDGSGGAVAVIALDRLFQQVTQGRLTQYDGPSPKILTVASAGQPLPIGGFGARGPISR